jgi:4-diphosphocytidyl-2-C-methyl-D-erythritol kinase
MSRFSFPDKGLKILAPAKVNLTLEILGKRADGYHEIRTLMQPISLFDTLWIEPGHGDTVLCCPGHPDLENPNNLILKAVRLLEQELAFPLKLSLRLRKRIPIGGGLGGGSSDAAALLWGVNHGLGAPLPPDRLMALASRLGSDIPFFLNKGAALASGRGERIEPRPGLPPWWVILIYPGFPVSTAWAYGQVKLPLTEHQKSYNFIRLKYKEGPVPGLEHLVNDLEPFVLPAFPILNTLKTALRASGCQQALMSGSGSTVFGIWEDKIEAARAFRRLKKERWGQVFLTRGLQADTGGV